MTESEALVNKVNGYISDRTWHRVEYKGSPLLIPISRQYPYWLMGDDLYIDCFIIEAITKLIRVYRISEVEL